MNIDTSLLKSKSIFPIVSPFSCKICSIVRSPSAYQTFSTRQEKTFCLLILKNAYHTRASWTRSGRANETLLFEAVRTPLESPAITRCALLLWCNSTPLFHAADAM
jgi:hypothetical protein